MQKILFIIFVFSFTAQAKTDIYSGNLLIKAKKNGIFFFCSSVAVAPTTLFTAAHCLDNASEVIVLVNQKSWPVIKFLKHPKYKRSQSLFMNDIGVIHLAKSLPNSIAKYKVQKPQLGDRFLRVGFGGRKGLNSRQVIDDLVQIKLYKNYIRALDSNSVSGDSGGAIFQKTKSGLTLVGIHSTIDGKYSFNPALSNKDTWVASQLKK